MRTKFNRNTLNENKENVLNAGRIFVGFRNNDNNKTGDIN